MPDNLLQVVPPRYRGAWKVGNSEAEVERWRAERRRHFPTVARTAVPAEAPPAAQAPAAAVIGVTQEAAHDDDGASDSGQSVDEEAMYRAVLSGAAAVGDGSAAVAEGEVSTAAVGDTGDLEGGDGDSDGAPDEAGVGLLDASAVLDIHIPPGAGLAVKPPPKPAPADTRLGVDAAAPDVAEEDAAPHAGPPLCRNFMVGRCKHGSHCRFSHDRSRLAGSGGGGGGGGLSGGMPRSTTACRMFLLGMCRRGAACGFSHGAVEGDTIGSRSHLLRKLLARDVAAETAATLQCIRYVVQAGFEPPPLPADAAAATASSSGDVEPAAVDEAGGGE